MTDYSLKRAPLPAITGILFGTECGS